jgi:hypothetical protein
MKRLFTPCTVSDSLLEAVIEALKNAAAEDGILGPAVYSNFKQTQDRQKRTLRNCRTVKSISRGRPGGDPNRNDKFSGNLKDRSIGQRKHAFFGSWFFEGKPRSEQPGNYLTERTPTRQTHE